MKFMRQKHNSFAIALWPVLVLLAGCSQNSTGPTTAVWPMYQYQSDHNAVLTTPAWNVTWRAHIEGKINGGISIVGSTLYVETYDYFIRAFDVTTGALKWKTRIGYIAMNAPIVGDGLAIVGTGDSSLLRDFPRPITGRRDGDSIQAISTKDGSLQWYYGTVGENMPTGVRVVVQGRPTFIFCNGDGHIYALEINSGKLLWRVAVPGDSYMSSLAWDGKYVYGVTTFASLRLSKNYSSTWAVRPQDGKFAWIRRAGNADCSPTVGHGMVFVENNIDLSSERDKRVVQNSVYGLDARTGKTIWKFQAAPGTASGDGTAESSIAGTYNRGVLYQSLPWIKQFVAFDATTGRILWKIHTRDPVKMSALVASGKVYVGDTTGVFYVVRVSDGTVEQQIAFPDIFTSSPPVIVGKTLFVANGLTLYALPLDDINRGTIPT